MNLNLIAPINTLSYGYTSVNFLYELSILGVNPSLFPIGHLEVTSEKYRECIQKSLNNQDNFDWSAPSLRIFHAFSLAEHVGRGKKIAFPIFELDSFTKKELHHLKFQDTVVVCSKWAQEICARHGIKSEVVPLGVDTDIFFPANKVIQDKGRATETVFMNISKWEVRKGHDVLLEAFNAAFEKTDNVRLVMMPTNIFIGQKGNDEWTSFYKNSKLGDKITILPRVSTQEEVAEIIHKADCGVFPSRAEGFLLDLLEFMACGKPVIITNYSGHTEYATKQNSHLIDLVEMESAYDGVFFFNQGQWASFGEVQIDQLVEYMRAIHQLKQSGHNLYNMGGVETARKLTWANAVKKLVEVIK